MPAWLVEGDPTVYFVLVCGLVACGVAWWRTRQRKYAIAGGVLAASLIGFFLLDRFIESDGEQMIREVQEIAAAVNARELNHAFQHVSEHFERAGVGRAGFRRFADRMIQARNVTSVQVWDFNVVSAARDRRRGEVECAFRVHGHWGETPVGLFARVRFSLDNDGQWRVLTFDVFKSITESTQPMAIPGWGSDRD